MKHFTVNIPLLFFFLCTIHLNGQNIKPYTIGAITSGSIVAVQNKVEERLKANNFEVLGSYVPINDAQRRVIVYTSPDILNAVKKIGGLIGFAAAWRIAITEEGDKTIISYTSPGYWGNAYFREDFEQVKNLYATYSANIKKALAECGDNGGAEFGSKDGHSIKKLRNYKYMMGMPKFHETKMLGEFASYEDAVANIDNNLSRGVVNLEKVFSIELKDQRLKLYGIGLGGEDGEEKFMPVIDTGEPKHTAFLPYELLVVDNQVHMLHGRYRIALSFPDLSMGRFMKIVSTPPAIKKMLEKVAN